jgi:hypothetical protein
MEMGNHSDSKVMGMGMGTEKTGMGMVDGIMGMGMGMGRGGSNQCEYACCVFIISIEIKSELI